MKAEARSRGSCAGACEKNDGSLLLNNSLSDTQCLVLFFFFSSYTRTVMDFHTLIPGLGKPVVF